MRYFCLLLLFFMSGSLVAGEFDNIKKDDEDFKRLMMSVDVKEDPKDANKLVFAIKMKASMLETVYLNIEDKNQALTTTFGEDTAAVTFEIEKASLEKANIFFSYEGGKKCPPSYSLGLHQFIP